VIQVMGYLRPEDLRHAALHDNLVYRPPDAART
jgi:hypothetical protein